jgi:hypothetical protein
VKTLAVGIVRTLNQPRPALPYCRSTCGLRCNTKLAGKRTVALTLAAAAPNFSNRLLAQLGTNYPVAPYERPVFALVFDVFSDCRMVQMRWVAARGVATPMRRVCFAILRRAVGQ